MSANETYLFFNSSLGIHLTSDQVSREIVNFINERPENEYKVTLGTDSEKDSENNADFVTAIVVHRVGHGGRYFWRRISGSTKYHTLRNRITQEVLISLDIAKNFLEAMKNAGAPKFDFEIHVDIGEHGATRSLIQELVGMIRANNFEVATKPNSYAASKVADRHV